MLSNYSPHVELSSHISHLAPQENKTTGVEHLNYIFPTCSTS